jgi:hypothetical protein
VLVLQLKSMVLNPTLFKEFAYLHSKLEPVCNTIYLLEGNSVTLGDAYYALYGMLGALDADNLDLLPCTALDD